MAYRMTKSGYKFSFKTSKDDQDNSNAKQTPKFLSIEFNQNSIHKPKSSRNLNINVQEDRVYRNQQNNSSISNHKRNQTALSKYAIAEKLDKDTHNESGSNFQSNQDFNDEIIRKQQFQSPNININININNERKMAKKQKISSQIEKKQFLKGTRRNLNKIWSQPKKYKSVAQNSLNFINVHSKSKPRGISDLWIPNTNNKLTKNMNCEIFQNDSKINSEKNLAHRNLRIKTQQQRSFVSSTSSQSLNRDLKESPRIRKNLFSPNFKNKTHQIRSNKSELINIIKLPSPVHAQLPIHLFTKRKEVRAIPEGQIRSPTSLQVFKHKNRTKKIMLLKKQVPRNSQYIDSKMQQLNKKLKILEIQTEFNFDASD